MHNINALEETYKKFTQHLSDYLPEGLFQVDIDLLQRLNLLSITNKKDNPSLTQYFHVVESVEKITLVNEQFIVWIVPENHNGSTCTYVLIALNNEEEAHLETGFVTSGVYNTSRLVLRILEKMLFDIQENEDLLHKFETK
jgi:hypothetical protein